MIEIYKAETSDLDRIKFNHWARDMKNSKAIKNFKRYMSNPLVHSFTIYDTAIDKPVAIMACHEYIEKCWYCCVVADECFGNNPKYAMKMKHLAHCVIADFGMQYVQTKSEDEPSLNKWHEFIGFKQEKKLPNHKNGIDYIIWSM